jgi:hypothetical protein
MKGIDVLREFQSGIVGIIGFGGVIITLWSNARIARNQREAAIDHERQTLRTALTEELKMLRDAYAHNAEYCARHVGKQGGSFDVPLLEMTDLYESMRDKLGLLSPEQLAATLDAYLSHKQVGHNIISLLEGDPIPSTRGVRVPDASSRMLQRLYETVVPKIGRAIDLLQVSEGERRKNARRGW